ncbi:hypothetical protein GCM10025793_17650 [Lysobacter lycopersici]
MAPVSSAADAGMANAAMQAAIATMEGNLRMEGSTGGELRLYTRTPPARITHERLPAAPVSAVNVGVMRSVAHCVR